MGCSDKELSDARCKAAKDADLKNTTADSQAVRNSGSQPGSQAALQRNSSEPDTDAQREYQKSDRDMRREAEKSAGTELSDKKCKDILKKRVDNMKKNWGETNEQKKQKKKQETAKAEDSDEKEMIDVSGIAKMLRSGPGYEV